MRDYKNVFSGGEYRDVKATVAEPHKVVEIDYTNWRGERGLRRIVPCRLIFENNEWHTETQWMIEAIDLDRCEPRVFALSNIHSWKPT